MYGNVPLKIQTESPNQKLYRVKDVYTSYTPTTLCTVSFSLLCPEEFGPKRDNFDINVTLEKYNLNSTFLLQS